MFFNKRKRYNGDVAVLLPALGIDMEDAGVFKLLNVLDIAYSQKYSTYEAALLVAYSYAGGLINQNVDDGKKYIESKLKPVEKDWLKKGIVRNELIAAWPDKLEQRIQSARA